MCIRDRLNAENRPHNGLEELRLEGNTSTYTANLTWDNHHNHIFEPVCSTPLTQEMLNSYVGWDVTDFVKAKAAEGATRGSFRISTPYKWRGLSRFTASESTNVPEHAPLMLIANKRNTPTSVSSLDAESGISLKGNILYNPSGKKVDTYNACGTLIKTSVQQSIDISAYVPGVYVALSESKTIKIAVH